MITTDLQDANIGQPSSPHTCTFMITTPNRMDNGYDLDGNMELSFEAVEGKGEFIADKYEAIPVFSEEDAVPDVNT